MFSIAICVLMLLVNPTAVLGSRKKGWKEGGREERRLGRK